MILIIQVAQEEAGRWIAEVLDFHGTPGCGALLGLHVRVSRKNEKKSGLHPENL
jgi:hypothetical protein